VQLAGGDYITAMDLSQLPLLSSLTSSSFFNITSIAEIIEPMMFSFTSVSAITLLSLSAVFAHPSQTRHEILKRDVDSFIATESPIALRDLLCNIGSTGSCVSGAASGLVIASPDRTSPDCKSRSASPRLIGMMWYSIETVADNLPRLLHVDS
jgi:glucoamylase